MDNQDFNNLPKQVLPMFATPLYASFVSGANSFANEVKNCNWKRTLGDDGFVTNDSYLLDNLQFKFLKKEIENHINFFVKDIAKFNNIEFYITNSWAVKHHKNDYAQKHFHSNSIFSGIVYLQCDNNSGEIIFHKSPNHNTLHPETFLFDINEYNTFNQTTQSILPQQEQILIFPSHLEHRVTRSASDIERIAIAFNTFFKGNLGSNPDTLSQLEIK